MYAVERTHPLGDDDDWLPSGVRRLRWLVPGLIAAGAGVAAVALFAIPPLAPLAKFVLIGGGAASVAGERVGARAQQRWLERISRGDLDQAALRQLADGETVRVRGRIDAKETLTGLLHGTAGVFRRMVFGPGRGLWVHEAAVDFDLIDAAGQRIYVHAGGARLLVRTEELLDYPPAPFLASSSPRVSSLVTDPVAPIRAREYVLPDGAEVEIVGVKTTSPDPEGAAAGYREPPLRPTLKSSRALPLLIRPV